MKPTKITATRTWVFSLLLAAFTGGATASASTLGTVSGTVLSGTYSLTQDIGAGYIVFSGTSGSGAIDTGDLSSTFGAPEAYSYTVPFDLGTGPIAFFGLAADADVVLTVNNAIAPGYVGNPWPYSQPESQVASWVRSGDTRNLEGFLNAHAGDFFYMPDERNATFLAYSNGTAIGAMSLTATPVPEPASWLFLLSGLAPIALSLRTSRLFAVAAQKTENIDRQG